MLCNNQLLLITRLFRVYVRVCNKALAPEKKGKSIDL